MTWQVGSWIWGDATQPTGHGAAFIAIDISAMGPRDVFESRIAAMIREEDAAKYLYWFGTQTVAVNSQDPAQNFASVSYGKSLREVCDTVVRGYVQSALSNEFMREIGRAHV